VLLSLLMLSLTPSASADTVLVPAFAAESSDDAEAALLAHTILVEALEEAGHTVIGPDALRHRAGSIVTDCALNAACVPALFSSWSAGLAVVGETYPDGANAGVATQVFTASQDRAVAIMDHPIIDNDWPGVLRIIEVVDQNSGGDPLVEETPENPVPQFEEVNDSSLDIDVLMDELSVPTLIEYDEDEPSPEVDEVEDEVTPVPVESIEQVDEVSTLEEPVTVAELMDDTPTEVPEDVQEQEQQPSADTEIEEVVFEDVAQPEEPELPEIVHVSRRDSGLGPALYAMYSRSSSPLERWLESWKPHLNSGAIEVQAGTLMGDVSRSYDVRVALDSSQDLPTIGIQTRDIYHDGQGLHASMGFTYAANPWLELSALVGVRVATKSLSTGWSTQDSSGSVLDSDIFGEGVEGVQSVEGLIEPRLRFYVLPVSPIKLYGLVGVTVRVSDGYSVEDLNAVDYPDRRSLTMFGQMLGGGLMIDPNETLGIYVEVPWVRWLEEADRSETSEGVSAQLPFEELIRNGWVIRGTVGLQFRL